MTSADVLDDEALSAVFVEAERLCRIPIESWPAHDHTDYDAFLVRVLAANIQIARESERGGDARLRGALRACLDKILELHCARGQADRRVADAGTEHLERLLVVRKLKAEEDARDTARQANAEQAAVDAIRDQQACRQRQACRVYLLRQYATRIPPRTRPPSRRELHTLEKRLLRARKILKKK